LGLAGAPVRITLIDRRNHHLFQPLLYQVATASLATSEIAWPIRYLLRGRKEGDDAVRQCQRRRCRGQARAAR
jgi:NADH dehydrogenase FAD-containing subunit